MTALLTDNRVSTMTSRERILECLRGNETDRFPVWLKMANGTWKSIQPEPYRSMDNIELQRRCGCDIMEGCYVPIEREAPHVTAHDERIEDKIIHTIQTPDGILVGEDKVESQTGSSHPTRFMLETPEDMKKLLWAYKETTYHVPEEKSAAAASRQKQLEADDIVTTSGCGPSPFMDVLQHLAGPINTYYLIQDDPDGFRELMDTMQLDRMRMLRAHMPHQVADTFWMTENTSTSLMSPAIFKEYCAPALKEYGDLCLQYDRIPVHHMCGTLNALLESIDQLPAVANEAYTTYPLGDVSLAEGRKRMPSKVLIGGTNATLWLEPVETIVQTVAEDLAACGGREKIFLTSAGVLPPPVSFAKAKAVVAEFKKL